MKKRLFVPSLMCADQLHLGDEIDLLMKYGFNEFHLDIMDLNFVPNITLGFDVIERIKEYNIMRDIHLMVKDVDTAIENLSLCNKDSVSVHIENNIDFRKIFNKIRSSGARVGLVISPNTPIVLLKDYINEIDLIHVMCVLPGFSSQEFIQGSYQRVEQLKELLIKSNKKIRIGVDGGISFEQIIAMNKRDVDVYVLGTSTLFKQDLEGQIKKFLLFKKHNQII